MRPFGVFGGMFDPIHYGHLRTAHELHELLGLEAVAFVPAGDPPHRAAPLADAATRLEMVRAARRATIRASWWTTANCGAPARPTRS